MKKHKQQIKENAWGEVYANAYLSGISGELTAVLHFANINPINYLNYVPSDYYKYFAETKIEIPDHIEIIGEDCFSHSYPLQNVKLPKSLKQLNLNIFDHMCADEITLFYPRAENSLKNNVKIFGNTKGQA